MTWNRRQVLEQFIKSIDVEYVEGPAAIFEDCGALDDTRDWLYHQAHTTCGDRPDLLAVEHDSKPFKVFLGTENLGVAGNSNRALSWFMNDTKADALILCNDDLLSTSKANFVQRYGNHLASGVGSKVNLLCLGDLPGEGYEATEIGAEPYIARKIMTGGLVAVTRRLISQIGYFDLKFGKFGEEHCDFTHRARLTGNLRIDGKDHQVLDIKNPGISYAKVESSLAPQARFNLASQAADIMKTVSYVDTGVYRPLLYRPNFNFGGYGTVDGFKIEQWPGYATVTGS